MERSCCERFIYIEDVIQLKYRKMTIHHDKSIIRERK